LAAAEAVRRPNEATAATTTNPRMKIPFIFEFTFFTSPVVSANPNLRDIVKQPFQKMKRPCSQDFSILLTSSIVPQLANHKHRDSKMEINLSGSTFANRLLPAVLAEKFDCQMI
jgi:hypothetical protein